MDAAGVCCERCPGATLANTRHIARRRKLKAAVFQPQQAVASHLGAYPPEPGARSVVQDPAVQSEPRGDAHGTAARRSRTRSPLAGAVAASAPASLYRAVTGQIIDVSPHVIAIGDAGGERRFALTADATAWRGSPLEPSALSSGDEAVIRLVPSQPGVADRVWANIGRVTGTIMVRDEDRLIVAEGATKKLQTVIIPARTKVRVQVRFPNLQPGYLIDIIGIRRRGHLEGLLPATPQPNYRSDLIHREHQAGGRLSETITGSATWHDSADEPYGVLGVSYPAVDPAAGCLEDSMAGFGPGEAPAFRDLPYLAVGTALNVRNECTGISCTLPVTGCAPMARLFNDRCVACANSPRGRVADLTMASFVALGGELEDGCFSATLTIGR
ncbi:MAG TPA: hypothetical protein VMU94_17620 [Streptosporangiaceae bacterium]|nr:hypothetical protein [Streptosporangiaceae bacterium]